MKNVRQWFPILTVVALLVATTALVISTGASIARAEPIERVDAQRVCMVNNTYFAKEQIPVEVDGKTYFGCCEMCKGRLASDAGARTATDPVSGKQVDKAKAIIGATPDGKVFYFESEKTFAEFKAKA